MRFSIIIPVHSRTEKFLKRCVGSIIDQSYYAKHRGNVEIIVVQDGPCETVKKFTERYMGLKYAVTNPEECQGAPAARNLGMKRANGDIIVFFDADSHFLPGALEVYDNALNDNPEAAFVYSDYALYTEEEGEVLVPSQPFDEYHLESHNFISTMNPFRREWFPGWDESLDSLQDWDFWLSIVKNGGKGVRIEGTYWYTEPPRDDTVSGDSAAHWLERTEKIKAKHGIPVRDICVSSLGAPQHGLRLAKILGADFNNQPGWRPTRYRLILILGFYPYTSGGLEAHAQLCNATNPETKLAIYWIGEDITQFRMLPKGEFDQAMKDLKLGFDAHLVEYEVTRAEVGDDFGLPAKILPHPIDSTLYEPWPYPEDFTVAMYHGQAGKYQVEQNIEVAALMPDVKFKMYGNAPRFWQDGQLPPNVEWCGFVPDMREFIKSTTALLRRTTHDGFCISHCEWVLAGRYVVTNVKHRPGALWVPDTKQGVVDGIRLAQELAGKEPDQERLEMIERYKTLTAPGPWIKRIRSLRDV